MDRDVLLRFLDEAENTDYAHDHLMRTYSAEGFKDILLKVRKALTGKDEQGVRPSDKKPGAKVGDHASYSAEGQAAIKELSSALDKYYLNDYWLDNQELVTGEIKADDFSEVFEVDGKVGDPFKNIEVSVKRVEQYIAKVNPILKQMDDQVQTLDKRIGQDTKNASLDDQASIDKVEEVIRNFKKVAGVITEVPKFPGTVLGNISITSKNIRGVPGFAETVVKKPKGVETLPALDKEDIKKAARLIKKCYDHKDPLVSWPGTFRWLDHSDGSAFNKWIYEADNSIYDDYYEIFYYQSADARWVEPIEWMLPEHRLASALERWIDRSIK